MLFASIFLNLSHIPANLISLGALDFGMVVDGAVVMMENIMRHLGHGNGSTRTATASGEMNDAGCDDPRRPHEVQRPVFYAIAIIITAYMPIFTLQRVEGRLFRPMAWTVAFALLGAIRILHFHCACAFCRAIPAWCQGMAQPGYGVPEGTLPARGEVGH